VVEDWNIGIETRRFFEKKDAKTFAPRGVISGDAGTRRRESCLLLFSNKKRLPYAACLCICAA
jgi:hypothetical protein